MLSMPLMSLTNDSNKSEKSEKPEKSETKPKAKAKENRQVTEDDVFREICSFSVAISPNPIFASVPHLATILETSKYQVRKHIKTLIDKGLIKLYYEGGQDEDGYPRCYKGYGTTQIAKQTDIYKEEYQKEIKSINEIFFGKEE